MTTLKTFLTGSLLALTMACGAAFAAPTTYHVNVSTQPFADQGQGYLELSLASPGTAAPASAQIRNLTGFGAGSVWFGDVSSQSAGTYGLSAPDAAVWQMVTFGGLLGFDVTFDGPDSGLDGARFTLALVGQDDYLTGSIAQIDLFAGLAPQIQVGDLVSVSAVEPGGEVPEPTALAMLATGLGLMGFTLRRRQR